MRNFTLTLLAVFATTLLFAQSKVTAWQSVNESQIQLKENAHIGELPQSYHTFELDLEQMRNQLAFAPQLGKTSGHAALELDLPLANGEMMTFVVVEASVMMPKLQAKYPQIRSYQAVGKDNPAYTARLDCNTLGFFARMRTPEGLMHISPYAIGQDQYYMSFFRKDYLVDENSHKSCGNGGHIDFENPINGDAIRESLDGTEPFLETKIAGTVIHRTYRLAIATTAQYTNSSAVGGVAGAISRITTATNTMNEIYQREVATTFVLIDDLESIIQTDENTQPYDNSIIALGGELLGPNHAALVDILGVDGFDIGHIFTVPCTDGVLGIARLGSLCNDNSKGAGVTCGYTNDIILMATETMAHEIGHQFNATHTWNNCGANNVDNWSSGTAYEPGSGTTIMSYAGVCGNQNVQFRNDTYFHVGSLLQMKNFLNSSGSTCAGDGGVDNDIPSITHNYNNGFYIPINTPFELTAEGSDPNGDQLFYNWDQVNKFPNQTPLGGQEGTSPSFRSLPPGESPTRVFPNMLSIILNNTFNQDDELLPSYSRNLKFRCVVRDGNTDASGVAWTNEISFEATDAAGPFSVTMPNTGSEDWEVGSEVEVQWDVANTDMAPVNCETVDILLSDNNGFDFNIPLVEGVPNNGSRMVVVPNNITDNARIKVKASENIFFDISNNKYDIIPATQPGFLFIAGPYAQTTCLPENINIDITTDSLLGYNEPLTFSATGLPAGATATFTPNPALPSEEVTMSIDMSGFTTSGSATITVTAEGANLPAQSREVNVNYIANDFSALATNQPAEGAVGQSQAPTFSWTDVQSVDSYMIEIATSPAFGSSTVETQSGITTNSYVPMAILDKSTIYYWRVTPSNACGSGIATATSSFQTELFSCASYLAENVEVVIPAQSNNTVTSSLNIPSGGAISDINIANVDLNYNPVQALRIEIESPGGEKKILYDEHCATTGIINIGFDQEAPNPISTTCPPVGGVAQPTEDISNFYGDDSAGEWTLSISTIQSGFGNGKLNNWSIEICSNSSVSGPTLITNEVLPVQTNNAQWISNLFLKATDPNTSTLDLMYTIVELPEYGQLELNDGTIYNIGDSFAQDDIDNKRIKYVHDGTAVTEDGFFFTISDGEGGYIGKTYFAVNIDGNNEPLSLQESLGIEWSIFPNPAQNVITLDLGQPTTERLNLSVINAQGQLIASNILAQGSQRLRLNSSDWPVGIYFVEISNGKSVSTEKVIIQR